ncbi:hypothetical protein ACFPRL_24575 [Pseudoclavibacter helvolus]
MSTPSCLCSSKLAKRMKLPSSCIATSAMLSAGGLAYPKRLNKPST